MLLTLKSNYIIGIDMHEEYYFFYSTLINSVWVPESFLFIECFIKYFDIADSI